MTVVIDVYLEGLVARGAFLCNKTLGDFFKLEDGFYEIIESALPNAGESEDIDICIDKLTVLVRNDLARLEGAIDQFGQGIQACRDAYADAQVQAITRALML